MPTAGGSAGSVMEGSKGPQHQADHQAAPGSRDDQTLLPVLELGEAVIDGEQRDAEDHEAGADQNADVQEKANGHDRIDVVVAGPQQRGENGGQHRRHPGGRARLFAA